MSRGAVGVRRSPSVRQGLGALLAAVVVLALALLFVTILQLRTANDRTTAEQARMASFRLADQMRQTSNDLTRMVRLYVATGQQRYRDYYDQILAIRRGDEPRPLRYDSSFWDRVLARGRAEVRTGPPISLPDLMRRAHFSPEEFRALNTSLRHSNELAVTEVQVMARVAPRIARGVDGDYPHDVAGQYRRLVDLRYHRQKDQIMAAVERFTSLVDQRTGRRADALQARTSRLLVAQMTLLALFVLAVAAALLYSARAVVRPLQRLATVARGIREGDWTQRARPGGVRELRQLAGDFNEMADVVQGDLAGRVAAEREARRAREAAETADRAKSAFLAMVSHELRTPLVAVTGTLEVLALDDLDGRQRELVDVAQRSASTLLAVIGDVLDFSKIESGHLDLDPQPVAIGRLVEELAAQYRHTAAAKGVTLGIRVDPPLAPVYRVDAERLRQVLGNLVGNAIKYTPGGAVELAVDVERGRADDAVAQTLAFTVVDTGIGVSPEDQIRLFSPFAQARARSDGTGLGLVIARQLTEAMGGALTMQSAVGEGTTMRVDLTLPVSAEGERRLGAAGNGGPTARRRLPTRDEARADGSLVLLVEDHPVNRAVLRRQLETIGFVTDVAGDAEAALERLRSERYGLVFSDIQLPDVDGYALVRRWRTEERTIAGRARVPIVALTASALRGEDERCRAAGMDDLVTKPAPMAALAGTLRRWLPHVDWAEPIGDGPGPLFDRDVLAEVTGGDEDLERTLLVTYAASLREDLERAERALADGDGPSLRRVAHQVVGASRTVGASGVAEAAVLLQRAVAEGEDPVALERALTGLREQIAVVTGPPAAVG